MPGTVVSSRSPPGHARSRRRSDERCTIATRVVASRAAACGSDKVITSFTGLRADRRCSRTSPCSVAGTIALFTKRAIRSSDWPTARCDSDDRTARSYWKCPARLQCLIDPVNALRANHGDAGLVLHSRTTMPGWIGEPLDIGYAIDVLHPRARRIDPDGPTRIA